MTVLWNVVLSAAFFLLMNLNRSNANNNVLYIKIRNKIYMGHKLSSASIIWQHSREPGPLHIVAIQLNWT